MGRQADCFAHSTQAAAAEHLHHAAFRCEHAPGFLEILLNNSMQQENEQALKRARDCEEVVKNQRADSCRQTSEQPVETEQHKHGHRGTEVRQAVGFLAHVRNIVDFFHHHHEYDGVDCHEEEDWCEECAVERISVHPTSEILKALHKYLHYGTS